MPRTEPALSTSILSCSALNFFLRKPQNRFKASCASCRSAASAAGRGIETTLPSPRARYSDTARPSPARARRACWAHRRARTTRCDPSARVASSLTSFRCARRARPAAIAHQRATARCRARRCVVASSARRLTSAGSMSEKRAIRSKNSRVAMTGLGVTVVPSHPSQLRPPRALRHDGRHAAANPAILAAP